MMKKEMLSLTKPISDSVGSEIKAKLISEDGHATCCVFMMVHERGLEMYKNESVDELLKILRTYGPKFEYRSAVEVLLDHMGVAITPMFYNINN